MKTSKVRRARRVSAYNEKKVRTLSRHDKSIVTALKKALQANEKLQCLLDDIESVCLPGHPTHRKILAAEQAAWSAEVYTTEASDLVYMGAVKLPRLD